MARRVILDVDPGLDDALALLLAARSPELELVGVTTVAGNVPVELGTRNALAILNAAGMSSVAVYEGARRPLAGRLTTASFFHGLDGLGGVELPGSPEAARAPSAVEFLVAAARGTENLTVVAVGPLTNIALACLVDPTFPSRLESLIIMGGAVARAGNVTPVAEANIYSDPEAAAIVLASGAPITLVGLDVTMQAALAPARFAQARSSHGADASGNDGARTSEVASQLIRAYLDVAKKVGADTVALHDPLAVAVAFDPSLLTTRQLRVEVELHGELTRGQTVAWVGAKEEVRENRGDYDDVVAVRSVEGTIDVALEVDGERFIDLLLERLLAGG